MPTEMGVIMRYMVDLFRNSEKGIEYDKAPAGSYCEIVDACDKTLIGKICIKPYCTNQGVVILGYFYGSTDHTHGIKRVEPLKPGDQIRVTIQ